MDKAPAAGNLNQFKPGKVGQALVAQNDVEWGFGLRHRPDRLFGIFGWGQSVKTKASEQALCGQQLKGMVLHQQDAKGISGHRGHTLSQASIRGV